MKYGSSAQHGLIVHDLTLGSILCFFFYIFEPWPVEYRKGHSTSPDSEKVVVEIKQIFSSFCMSAIQWLL